MRPKNDPTDDGSLSIASAAVDGPHGPHGPHGQGDKQRHSDVVPRSVGGPMLEDGLLGGAPHLSWPETHSLRVPDERRAAWMNAYEASFDQVFESCDRGDWLVPLIYAEGANDARLARALLRFAHEVSLELEAPEAALAMLEVIESMLHREISKDLCLRIADNLVDEAYEHFASDRSFDRYFFCHCAAAVARLAARVQDPSSARDAVDAIHSGVAALRVRAEDSEQRTLRTAARLMREELDFSPLESAAPAVSSLRPSGSTQ